MKEIWRRGIEKNFGILIQKKKKKKKKKKKGERIRAGEKMNKK